MKAAKVKIKHIDGATNVMATVHVNEEVNLEYRFQGMAYGVTMSIKEATEKGIIKSNIKQQTS